MSTSDRRRKLFPSGAPGHCVELRFGMSWIQDERLSLDSTFSGPHWWRH